MRAQEAFDELVDGGVWPVLLVHGFLRSRYTFHRRVGENWQVINLQKSSYSSAERVRFTINLGVAHQQLRTGSFDWKPGRRPSEASCHFRVRIGRLLRERDTWWDVSADSNVTALAETICLVLTLYAFPWLEAHSTDERLLETATDATALRELEGTDSLRWLAKRMGQLGELEARRTVDAESARRHAERLR